jgi:hypothetical protein
MDERVRSLENDIRDLGEQIDSYRAATGGALGGAVFLLLLSACGLYDILSNNASIWSAVGLSPGGVYWLTLLLGAAGLFLLFIGISRTVRKDRSREDRLEEMQRELADLIELKQE